MKCYQCGAIVGAVEHERVLKVLDDDCHGIVERLGLTHARPATDEQDVAGRVIICIDCVEGAK